MTTAVALGLGAIIGVPLGLLGGGGDEVAYERCAVADGNVIDAGPLRLQVMHTPGHTQCPPGIDPT